MKYCPTMSSPTVNFLTSPCYTFVLIAHKDVVMNLFEEIFFDKRKYCQCHTLFPSFDVNVFDKGFLYRDIIRLFNSKVAPRCMYYLHVVITESVVNKLLLIN